VAIERALATLREFAACAHELGATPAAVATQALREVENPEAFLAPAQAILGCRIEVVSGEREAELSWRATQASFPTLRDAVVMDVGGGSTEFVVVQAGAVARRVSIAIGSVRLSERLFAHDPPTGDEVVAAQRAVAEALAGLALPKRLPLVGIAGTVTSLAAMQGEIDPYDPERVHGSTLTHEQVTGQIARLVRLPLAERRRLRGLDPARADVILAGALIVQSALAELGVSALVVSDRGVRWGLLYEQL
jgi:exopolyphosphatase/guanosine-5'-triphosphate,3'-diphosphate pyrophosphatase